MTEIENFHKLMQDLREANERQDMRKVLLVLGLYNEYVINELIRMKLGYSLDETLTSEKIKLIILKACGIIQQSEYEVLSKLNEIRNRYIHDLHIDINRIEEMMKGTPINWSFDNNSNINIKELNKFMRKNPILKFQGACVTKLSYLLKKIAELKGEDTSGIWGISILLPPEVVDKIIIK